MKIYRSLSSAFMIAGISLLSGCSLVYDREVEYEYVAPPTYPVLNAVGMAPIAEQTGADENIRVLRAMKASKLEAYRELTEQVYGLQLNGQQSVEQMVLNQDDLKARVDGVIRGAKVLKSYRVGDNYVTEMELDMEQVNLLIWSQNPPRQIKRVRYY